MFHVKTFRNDNYFLSSSILPLLFYYFVSFEKKMSRVKTVNPIPPGLPNYYLLSTFLFTLSNLGVESWRLKCSKRKSTDSRTSQLFNIIRVWRVDEVEEKKIQFSVPPNKRPPRFINSAVDSWQDSNSCGEFQGKSKKASSLSLVSMWHSHLSHSHMKRARTNNRTLWNSQTNVCRYLISHNKKIIMFHPFYCI